MPGPSAFARVPGGPYVFPTTLRHIHSARGRISLDEPIGQLIRTADAGDPDAASALFGALYRELHAIAERQLHRGPETTLGTTTLLHEAYLNISSREGVHFASREHFLAYAARSMRGLMIDYARRHQARKRGGEFHITSPTGAFAAAGIDPPVEQLEDLAAALETLREVDPALAQLVDLHFFCGFSLVEIAHLREVSERTVQRDWRKARLLLHRTLQEH